MLKNGKIQIFGNITFHVVLDGCKTWFLLLTKEQRLRVSDKRVGIIFEKMRGVAILSSRFRLES
jgi:hypothetical protein